MFRNFLIITILSFTLLSCKSTNIEDTYWLKGQWEYSFNESIEMEKWTSIPNKMNGIAYFINHGDSNTMRHMEIIKENGDLVLVLQESGFEYISKYKITFLSSDSLVAKTSSNIWPQKITYVQRNENQLVKHMSGKQQQMHNVSTSYYTRKFK